MSWVRRVRPSRAAAISSKAWATWPSSLRLSFQPVRAAKSPAASRRVVATRCSMRRRRSISLPITAATSPSTPISAIHATPSTTARPAATIDGTGTATIT